MVLKSPSNISRPITIDDVAALSGVSRITVSRALLSNPQLVAKETRLKIEAAANALGYVPNLAASALSGRKSGIIAALVSTLGDSYFTMMMEGIQNSFQDTGLQLLIGDMRYNPDNEDALLRRVLGRQPDGLVITTGEHSAEAIQLLKKAHIPIIEAWDLPEDPIHSTIGFDNYEGGVLVAEHFMRCGYRQPVYVAQASNPPDGLTEKRALARWHGFRDTLRKKAGLDPRLILSGEPGTFEAGAQIMDQLIAQGLAADAIFFVFDIWAVGAVYQCQRRGVDIPGQLGICGFGDVPISSVMVPRLTTVRIAIEELGMLVGQTMIRMLSAKQRMKTVTKVELSMIAGETTRMR